MVRSTRRLGVLVAVAAVAVLAVGQAGAAAAAPGNPGSPRYIQGSSGIGDPYFPLTGNGGIDVTHYDLTLHYMPPAPAPAALEGTLTATRSSTSPQRRTWTSSISICAVSPQPGCQSTTRR